ncbi:LacI family transcriptional regulator [Treponema phagedenis]|uniref:Transcriptional regulator, LacI family n=1 Tax=Treponema phagedenis TaxID=162 RepID=A0A0B7GYQ2_TREPH|nr:LacI family DNA-binding transcriptional regulator [Treponema phagedenis]NVP23422.1 LacI family DNA-binding transcriptional regulator [Treponema phagedenis]QEJ95640.1 LacI family transcriptional regulator [Treponema phagedenis]QKS92856.1 LacI family DNA-binding transcriptional regulator [Treponema phagedenis]QLC58268.1 LacI family DNA-binding transcriptional regulator [Treponema phagedenis]QSI00828.1 LacI family transcriptional regulator [Treponema phagedenis]
MMVTMQDIADRLNISRNTVSKVLNNRSGVSEKKRSAIIQTALELGYPKVPSSLLHSHKEKDKKTKSIRIALLVVNPQFSQFWVKLINSIAKEIGKSENTLTFCYLSETQQESLPATLNKNTVDAIIGVNIYNTQLLKKIAGLGIPTVYFDMPVKMNCRNLSADIILLEGRNSIYSITEHLIKQGCKSIGFIGDITYAHTMYERYQGFITALKEYRIAPIQNWIFTRGLTNRFYNPGEIAATIDPFDKEPDAIVCANDAIAVQVISYFNQKGMRCPDDILISGYDNFYHFPNHEHFLTTVEVNIDYLGKRLVEQVYHRAQNPGLPLEMTTLITTPLFKKSTEKASRK